MFKQQLLILMILLSLGLMACGGDDSEDNSDSESGDQAAACTHDASIVRVVSFPNGTGVQPGTPATREWRIQNTGTCAWDSDYRMAKVSGDQISVIDNPALPVDTIDPDSNVLVSVIFSVTDDTLPGDLIIGEFQMQTPDGETFGQVSILEVTVLAPGEAPDNASPGMPPSGSSITSVPPFMLTPGSGTDGSGGPPTIDPNAPTFDPADLPDDLPGTTGGSPPPPPPPGDNPPLNNDPPSDLQSDCDDDMVLADAETTRVGETAPINTLYERTWVLENSGTCTWENYQFELIVYPWNKITASPQRVTVPTTEPGETAEVTMNLVVAGVAEVGEEVNVSFRLLNPSGLTVGLEIPYTIIAREAEDDE